MYFLVQIKESREKVIVPKKWIHGLNFTELLNYGLTFFKKRNFKVFFSLNSMDIEPDFKSITLDKIDQLRPACYTAKLVKCCGSYIKYPLE